jgi:NADPH:quinone reductase-like Zn-dependent oxidoreductase
MSRALLAADGSGLSTMKALVYERYGTPDVLQLRDVPAPAPKAGQVLVEVHAASVNSWDWDLLIGSALVRPWGPLKPQHPILGCDIAGRIVALGPEVRRFNVGDEVFGDISASTWGGFAEHAAAPEDALQHKPPALSFEQAAAIPQAGVLALQGLRAFGEIRPGHRLLINGAGGGVGTFALQLAKARGAEVTVVDTAAKLPALRALGADAAVDYASEDFTRRGPRYDFVLDVVGRRPLLHCLRVVAPAGCYVMIGGTVANILKLLALRGWVGRTSRKRAHLLVHRPDPADLAILAQQFEAGRFMPVIDSSCPLERLPDAIGRLGQGLVLGKLIVTVRASG